MRRLLKALRDVALTSLMLSGGALSSGCGVSPAGAPASYHDYALQQAQITCETRYRCCGISCTAGSDAAFNLNMVSTQKLLEAGKLRFDANAAQTCLESQRNRDANCDLETLNRPSLNPVCAQVLVGTIEINQTCNPMATIGCVANAYCDGTALCRAYLADGATCSMGGVATGRCKPTSFCDPMSNLCRTIPKSGEPCMGAPSCDTTGERLVCAPDMRCSPPLADGATCTSNAQCRSNTCSTVMPRVCVPPAVPPTTVRDTVCGAR
jgi:hypothetical protein